MKLLRSIGYFVSTLFVYLGITLLGWGIPHLSQFFASAERSIYSIVVTLFSLMIGIQAYENPEGIDGGKGQKNKDVNRQTLIGGLLSGLLVLNLLLLPWADQRNFATLPDTSWLRNTGLILGMVGYLYVFLSGLYLGKQYSAKVTIQENHELITQGPYHTIRHPRYLGVLCLSLGSSLLFRCWIGLLLFGVHLILIIIRVKDEEHLMQSEFGAKWQTYCSTTKKLIPFIY